MLLTRIVGIAVVAAQMATGVVGVPAPPDARASSNQPANAAQSESAAERPDDDRTSLAAMRLPGREDDARVAGIAFALATSGRGRCPVLRPDPGLVLQHLSQFELADRPGMIATRALDRGPGVIVVVPGGPAAAAGIRAGDVLLSIDGVDLPGEPGLAEPFETSRAHARADAIHELLATAKPITVGLLRDGTVLSVRLAAVSACPSRVHLARSAQRNAYADGRHVLLAAGLLALLHDDDELAFVIAHEMAHNILGHATIMRSGAVRRGLGRTLGQSGQIVRGTERAADALGGELMIDAGFDPVRGSGILARLGGTDLGIGLFAAHDSASDRIAAMRLLAARRSR